jgi:predicted PurR-regulated permease PerM
MNTEVVSTLVSSLGVVGALVWYLYHNTTTTIPNLTKQYTESQERVSERFAETQKAITDNFSATLREEREYRKQEIGALQQWIKSEASCKYNQDRHV